MVSSRSATRTVSSLLAQWTPSRPVLSTLPLLARRSISQSSNLFPKVSHSIPTISPLRTPVPPTQARSIHSTSRLISRPIPAPTPFVPNVETFLKLIGRETLSHLSRIPSWDALFRMTSQQMQTAGIEPARQRRYILWWRERFRQGEFGVGGDFKYVSLDGVAELRVYEQPFSHEWIELAEAKRRRQIAQLREKIDKLADTAPDRTAKMEAQIRVLETNPATTSRTPNTRLLAVNVPPGTAKESGEMCPVPIEDAEPLKFIKVVGARSIAGPYVMPLAGTDGWGATVTVQEGLWEVKRGQKIDGGERRKAEVRAKRRVAENRA